MSFKSTLYGRELCLCVRRRFAVQKSSLFSLVTIAALFVLPAQAQVAQVAVTYVSGLGSDSNPCTRSSPCKTLQKALTKTSPGGQINALNSANYGYLQITQAVSIIGTHGAAGVLATSAVTGVSINAGANDKVTLQGLELDGAGSGASGIQFTSGASLSIRDSVIRGFVNGINFQPSGSSALSVGTTLVANNSTGVVVQATMPATAIFDDVQIMNNGSGIVGSGASATARASLTVQNCVVANNNIFGILSNGSSDVTVSNCMIANNGVGLAAQNTGALLQLSGSTVSGNSTAWQTANNGQVSSAGNSVGGNTASNAPLTPVASASAGSPTSPSHSEGAPPPAFDYLVDGSGTILVAPDGTRLTAL